MRLATKVLAGVAVLTVVMVTCGAAVISSVSQETPAPQEPLPSTGLVELGKLSAMVSLDGTLTYRGRSDGSPYAVINQARGTYTGLPDVGDSIACGNVLYRVDDRPVVLLCGAVPAWRSLHSGAAGDDVRQLNQNLHALGYDTRAGVDIDPFDTAFTAQTEAALQLLQRDRGLEASGALDLGDAVFLPESIRIAQVTGELGGSAESGAPVLSATSETPEVQVALDPSQQGDVKEGQAAQITLPGNTSVTGRVVRVGRVAQVPPGQNSGLGAAIIPAYISLDDPQPASGLDRAPVQVDIATQGVENALSVPVTALVGNSGGGFAVEVLRTDGSRDLVAVKLGLFDTTAGRVQVDGNLRAGDQVVVPSP